MRRYEFASTSESFEPPKFSYDGRFLTCPEAVLFVVGASESALRPSVLEYVVYSYKADMNAYGDLDLFDGFDCSNWCSKLHESLDRLHAAEEVECSPAGYILKPAGAVRLQDIQTPAGGAEKLQELIAGAETILKPIRRQPGA